MDVICMVSVTLLVKMYVVQWFVANVRSQYSRNFPSACLMTGRVAICTVLYPERKTFQSLSLLQFVNVAMFVAFQGAVWVSP